MPTAKQLKSRYQRKELVKKILKGIGLAGAVYIAAGSPYFVFNIMRNLGHFSIKELWEELTQKEKKQMRDTFGYLRRNGMIQIAYRNNQAYISLTKEGKKKAKQYQIDELEIARPKNWDHKWRIILFDIPEKIRIRRELLRGKLKELGFTMIQRSVWVHPYPCHEELQLLKDFFGFKDSHYLLIKTDQLGHYANALKRSYKLRSNQRST